MRRKTRCRAAGECEAEEGSRVYISEQRREVGSAMRTGRAERRLEEPAARIAGALCFRWGNLEYAARGLVFLTKDGDCGGTFFAEKHWASWNRSIR